MVTRKKLRAARKRHCRPDEVILALQLLAEGFSVAVVAIKFDVAERTVWRWLARARREARRAKRRGRR